MSKFKIFCKDKKFHLTDNKLFSFQMILLAPCLIHEIFFKETEYSPFEMSLLYILVFLMLISLILNLSSYFRYKPLEGKIEGEIELLENEIIINKEVLKIYEIKNIEITNDDFLDFIEPYNKYVMLGRKSHGVNNEIQILLNNRKKYKINYQQDQNHDMQDCKELLKIYYSKGIITIENLLYVLGIVDDYEKREFEKTLAK
jgi:hypothetical protein